LQSLFNAELVIDGEIYSYQTKPNYYRYHMDIYRFVGVVNGFGWQI